MSDLSSTVNGFATATYTVSRSQPGSYVNGRFVPGQPISLQVAAMVVPTSGKDLQRLPEGQRTREAIAVYSASELKTADEKTGTKADLIMVNGRTFEVQSVQDWSASGGFYKSVALRVAAAEG